MRYGLRVDADDTVAMNVATRTAGFGDEVKRRIMLGTYVLSAGYMDAYYNQALRARTRIIGAFATVYDRCDALIGPTSPTTAFPIGSKTDDLLAMYHNDVCTIPSNLTGEPAVSVPFGAGDDGLPVGVQVLGPSLSEATVLRVAAVLEAAAPPSTPPVPVGTGSVPGSGGDMTDGWEVVIGLEVHCELKTHTKLFCGCLNAFGDEPNTNICPTCVGLPGSLPVLNRRAVELAMALGSALDCEIRPSTFHRKNYFYPDQAKDYQISQYDEPINVNGRLELPDGTRVGIVRAHHRGGHGQDGARRQLRPHPRGRLLIGRLQPLGGAPGRDRERARLALLRAGPCLRHRAARGPRGLGRVGREDGGGVDAGRRQRVRPPPAGRSPSAPDARSRTSTPCARSAGPSTTRWTGKLAILESGGQVVQETRHWDEDGGRTVGLRSKEEAYDYRYFLEPDLVPLDPDRAWVAAAADIVGLLPAARRQRLVALLDGDGPLPPSRLDQVATVVDLGLDDLVVEAVAAGVPAPLALSRTANEAATDAEAARRLPTSAYVGLLSMEADGSLTTTQAKAVLAELLAGRGDDPAAVAAAHGFEAMTADSLTFVVAEVVAAHPDEWERFKAGGETGDKLIGFFTGLVMRQTSKGGRRPGGGRRAPSPTGLTGLRRRPHGRAQRERVEGGRRAAGGQVGARCVEAESGDDHWPREVGVRRQRVPRAVEHPDPGRVGEQ